MSMALDLLARVSPTRTPIGACDFCQEVGPLKEVKRKGDVNFYCIPCVIDGNAE